MKRQRMFWVGMQFGYYVLTKRLKEKKNSIAVKTRKEKRDMSRILLLHKSSDVDKQHNSYV